MLLRVKFPELERPVGKMGMVTYSIGDFLIRLKNMARADKKEISLPGNKLIVSMAKALEKAGFLEDVKSKDKTLSLSLRYAYKEPVLTDVKLISKPGLRIYKSVRELEEKKGSSILIISTPKGILTHREAIKARLGGEVIAEIS
jgi:small subunit ribosomal protein S8